ncbi:MAG: NAD-dependent epimerase/dehydratase family protein [Alphaproteobacteria bacterium]|nr:NAD-dependent epimerase/dehydratase family protein [Alphaproteobacteria bacterium]MBU1514470.1 NAD-dependent epimerase/dehydratase family protein [Alphaproteobacteria bacterium]MBU2096898.1 NAD-dependent epimerase/dehydratase family protein [Alphaproteobacteria bacterium]MBU2153525.1 NAD-dependent epimerase/dehydratase family protein [Alphaproteobacteria bacterium]MBU2305970.1 NAD-dependent epimerase/dehydratase family protein [Alphaproteobacteria bacterium]
MAGTVLLTGASSFTGVWIAEALAEAGFRVIAPLLRARSDYDGVRLDRVVRLEQCAQVSFGRAFGSETLLADIRASGGLDVLAHHAAHITGYREPGFDAVDALARNTAGAPALLRVAREAGARLVVLTGSVFEAGEGGGDEPGAVTPYGLSKTLTSQTFDYWTRDAGLSFGRFVIPSPYGALEERRFGWHLFKTWFAGGVPEVRTPRYVRDHLAAPRLAKAYAEYVAKALGDDARTTVARPSGWIAPQGEFAQRVAAEASRRLGRDCRLELADQTVLDEPLVRVNDQPAWGAGWDEEAFWDGYVAWYAALHKRGVMD